MDKQEPESRMAVAKRWFGWTEVPLAIAGVITVAWSLITFLLPAADLDLVVWVEKGTTLYPGEATDERRLGFTFEGRPVTSARVWLVRVTNEGKAYIGEQGKQWELVLSHPDAQMVRVIDTPAASSGRIPVAVATSSAPNEARVRIGTLEHRQEIIFRLLLLNGETRVDRLRAVTTLAGIPRPLLTSQHPQDRLTSRLAPFSLSAFAVLMVWASVKEMRQNRELRQPTAILKYAGFVLIGSMVGTLVVANTLGWALRRFL